MGVIVAIITSPRPTTSVPPDAAPHYDRGRRPEPILRTRPPHPTDRHSISFETGKFAVQTVAVPARKCATVSRLTPNSLANAASVSDSIEVPVVFAEFRANMAYSLVSGVEDERNPRTGICQFGGCRELANRAGVSARRSSGSGGVVPARPAPG